MGLSGPALRTAIGLVAGLCFLSFGYGQGDIGGLMVMPAFRQKFPQIDQEAHLNIHTANLDGITVAMWNLGCFVGAMLTIFLGDVFGRKRSIMIGLIGMIIGKILQTSSFSLGQFMVGRIIAGLGNGYGSP
jgi:MFS family permease